MIRCTKCLMPTTRPDTAFHDGVCSACISYEKRKQIDWVARKEELRTLLDRHDGRCIVPSSGGKDSHAQVLTLLEMGADVTIVTATTCHLTEVGRANIDNLARYARTVEVTPNMTVRAKLNRLALEMVGDISWGEHVSIHRVPFRIACDLQIPLMFYGECPNEAYGGPPGTEETRRMTQRWAAEFGGFLGLRPSDFVGVEGITERDMADYRAPDDSELQKLGVEAHFLGQYLFWDSHANARKAKDAGMKQVLPTAGNWWIAENLDNAQTGLHDYAGYLKYGYGRAAAQMSVDIRAGLLTREAALKLLEAREHLFPGFYAGVRVDEVLDRIGMTRKRLMEVLTQFTNKDLFDEMPCSHVA